MGRISGRPTANRQPPTIDDIGGGGMLNAPMLSPDEGASRELWFACQCSSTHSLGWFAIVGRSKARASVAVAVLQLRTYGPWRHTSTDQGINNPLLWSSFLLFRSVVWAVRAQVCFTCERTLTRCAVLPLGSRGAGSSPPFSPPLTAPL